MKNAREMISKKNQLPSGNNPMAEKIIHISFSKNKK